MADKVRYGGNPEHKWFPADYGLTPPANPRPGKALCDGKRAILKVEALSLVQAAFLKGMVSPCSDNQWPQNAWSVAASGEVFEAQLENSVQGIYHGYPMPLDDDFRKNIIMEWIGR